MLDSGVTPCVTESNGTAVTSETCSLSSITAGDIEICFPAVYSPASGGNTYLSITSSLNQATLSVARYYNTGSAILNVGGQGVAFYPNSASGSDTLTITQSSSTSYLSISCAAFKHVNTTAPLDTGSVNLLNADVTGANPTAGTAAAPSNSGELVIGVMQDSGVQTPTAGSGYTLIGSLPDDTQFPEYQIQTTATSTNAPYTMSSDTWTDLQVAFLPSGTSGGASAVLSGPFVNFENSTSGTQITGTLMNSNTSGTGNNSSGTGAYGSWGTNSGYSYFTFNSAAAMNCGGSSFWDNGSTYAVSAGSLGAQYTTGTGSSQFLFTFGSSLGSDYPSVTVSFCFETTLSQTDSSSNRYSLGAINGYSAGYCNPQIQPNGTNLYMYLEGSGATSSSGIQFASNTIYRVQYQYQNNGSTTANCQMAMYNTSGTQVGSTITATGTTGAHYASSVSLGISGGEPETSGGKLYFDNLEIAGGGYVSGGTVYGGIFPLP